MQNIKRNKSKQGYNSIEILIVICIVVVLGIAGILKLVDNRDSVSNELDKSLSSVINAGDTPGGGGSGGGSTPTPTPAPPTDAPEKNCVYEGEPPIRNEIEIYPYLYRNFGVFTAKYIGTELVVVDAPCTSITGKYNNGTLIERVQFNSKTLDLVDFAKIDTSNYTVVNSTFKSSNIKSLKMNGFNFNNIKDVSYMFMISKIKNIDFTGVISNELQTVARMFDTLRDNIDLKLTGLDTSNVTDFSGMFTSATIQHVDITPLNTSKATNMSEMFYCLSTTTLTIGNLDTTNVTNMDNMFAGLRTKELDLSQFNIPATATVVDLFKDSTVETVYVMNQENLDRIKASSNLPSTINFIIK